MHSPCGFKTYLILACAISATHATQAQSTDFETTATNVDVGTGFLSYQMDSAFQLLLSGSQVGVDLDLDCIVDVEISLPFPDYLGDYPDFEHYVLEIGDPGAMKPYYMGSELVGTASCDWRLSYYTMTGDVLDSIYSTIMFGTVELLSPISVRLHVQSSLEWPVNGDATNLLGFGVNAHIAITLADFSSLTFASAGTDSGFLSADVTPSKPESTNFDIDINPADMSTPNPGYRLLDVFSILYSGQNVYVDTDLDCIPDVEILLGFNDYLAEYVDPEHYVLEFAESAPMKPYFLGSPLASAGNCGWRLSYYTLEDGELGSIVSTIMSGSYIDLGDGTARLYVADAFEWPVNGDAKNTFGYGVNAHLAAKLADFKTFNVDFGTTSLGTMSAEVVDACIADLNNDSIVSGADLGLLIASWGPCSATGPCTGDINGNGIVDGADLGSLMASWGPCS